MMEKGSFHTSGPAPLSQKEIEEKVKAVPLPNQLPKGIDFTDIPPAALKSSTLEILINQNEDLMARLSVALRRNNDLEERVAGFERESLNMRNRFEALKEQYLVLQEKDRRAGSRSMELHEQNAEFRQKIGKLEKMYAGIFVQAQAFQRRLVHLERYRARVKKASQGLRNQLSETKHLREQVKNHASQQMAIVSSYETKLTEAREMVDSLREKAAERDRMYGEKVQIENTLVYERRQAEMTRTDAQTRIDNLDRENGGLRVQVKEMLVERESNQQELEKMRQEVPHLRDERIRLTEQVESLQALWSHKQREFEHLEEKNKNLQKLNQNISVNLNQQRKEIHTLKNELEKERFASGEKLKVLLQEIQLLRDKITELEREPEPEAGP
jgi:chromosome segregation ATPase